jgi:hypothetical protein
MQIETWKKALINEIETAAAWRAERVLADPDDPRNEKSQKALLDLAEKLKATPDNHAKLNALFREEQEMDNLMRAPAGEPERRYHDAKEELLQAYGFEQEPFATVEAFLDHLRAKADETISEYRLRV